MSAGNRLGVEPTRAAAMGEATQRYALCDPIAFSVPKTLQISLRAVVYGQQSGARCLAERDVDPATVFQYALVEFNVG